MGEYPKPIKRLIREYAARAYEAELGRALGELETQFSPWRSSDISAGGPGRPKIERRSTFHQGPARDLWNRYKVRIDYEVLMLRRRARQAEDRAAQLTQDYQPRIEALDSVQRQAFAKLLQFKQCAPRAFCIQA
ncbi:MAG: hypothetical protein HC828_02495 [Blastochloris sp.]|nr:hypothetical protein [Blastochloris sp.]